MIDPIPTVIGIDANSHKLALVWKRDGSSTPHLKTFELPQGDSALASAKAFRDLSEFFFTCTEDGIFDPHNTVVYIEAPVMGVGGPGPTIAQAYVQGAVYAWAGEFSLKISRVNNQSWKKKILGRGNVKKLEVTPLMEEVWPELVARAPIIHRQQWAGGENDLPDQDLIDAGAVHLFGEWKEDLFRRILKARKSNAASRRRLETAK